jgi:hypothetical protein
MKGLKARVKKRFKERHVMRKPGEYPPGDEKPPDARS